MSHPAAAELFTPVGVHDACAIADEHENNMRKKKRVTAVVFMFGSDDFPGCKSNLYCGSRVAG